MDNGSRNLNDLYKIINTYRNDMASGERVELIISPNRKDHNQRIITIGLQDGLSRNRQTFLIEDGNKFDNETLVEIINYYSQDDSFKDDKKITRTTLKDQTSKAIYETESSNLLYIETFNNNLFDKLKNNQAKENKFERIQLTQEQKDWEEIIYYAKERRITEDYVKRNGLDSMDVVNIDYLLKLLSKNKKFVPGYSKAKLETVTKNLEKLLSSKEWSDELIEIGIDSDTYEKSKEILNEYLPQQLLGTALTEKFARILQAEKRIVDYSEKRKKNVEFNEEEFFEKVEFATSQLEKAGYFELKNASIENFLNYKETKEFGKTLPGAILKLRNRYENKRDIDIVESQRVEQYINYCDEILAYLETNALANEVKRRKANSKKVDISLLPYEENINIINDEEMFKDLLEKINLCKNARVNNENFELIIEHDKENINKRTIRLSITNGMNRTDDFEFKFENGLEFDKKISEVINNVSKNDNIKNTNRNLADDSLLLTTENGNEILIKLSSQYSLEKKEEKNEKEQEIKQDEKIIDEDEENEKIVLQEDDKKLLDYFKLLNLKESGNISQNNILEIKKLAETNERVAALEDAIKKVENGELSQSTLDKIKTTYKAQLALAIKKASAVTPPLISPKQQELRKKNLNLDTETKELAEYFRYEILKNKNQLPPSGIKRIEELKETNEKVAALEEARKRLENGKLTQKEFEHVHDHYRKYLADKIKDAAKKSTIFNLLEEKNTYTEEKVEEIKQVKETKKNIQLENLEKTLLQVIDERLSKQEKKIDNVEKEINEKTEFDELHDLFKKYKIINIDGNVKIFDRETSIECMNSEKEQEKITFAHFWQAAAGLKLSPNDIAAGEKYAFSDDSRTLFNIMNVQYRESIVRGIPIDYESLKNQFESSHHEKANEIYERLFKDPYYREFISNYYRILLKNEIPKHEINEKSFEEEKTDSQIIEEEIKQLKEIIKKEDIEDLLTEKYLEEKEEFDKENIQDIQEENNKSKEDFLKHLEQKINEVLEQSKKEQQEENKQEVQKESNKTKEDFLKHLEQKINEVLEQREQEQQEENNKTKADFLKHLEQKINEVLEQREQEHQEVQEKLKSNDILEIRDAYEVASECSTIDNPASLKIYFQKDNPENVEIIISNGQGLEEEVIYQKVFSKEEVMGEMIEEICNVYITENSMTYNQTFQVPNTNKAGSITLGENDNVLQMSNAPKEYVEKLQSCLEMSFNNAKKINTKAKKH